MGWHRTQHKHRHTTLSSVITLHIHCVDTSLMSSFRHERSRRADMLAMDTNKLVIRLEKLMTSLPVHDPVKRRAHEQAVVPWAPEDVVKLCPNCAKSFNLTRSEQQLFALQLKVSKREPFFLADAGTTVVFAEVSCATTVLITWTL